MTRTIENVLNYLNENLEYFFLKKDFTFQAQEIVNLNDDYIMHISIFLVAIICIFIVCVLNHYYQNGN